MNIGRSSYQNQNYNYPGSGFQSRGQSRGRGYNRRGQFRGRGGFKQNIPTGFNQNIGIGQFRGRGGSNQSRGRGFNQNRGRGQFRGRGFNQNTGRGQFRGRGFNKNIGFNQISNDIGYIQFGKKDNKWNLNKNTNLQKQSDNFARSYKNTSHRKFNIKQHLEPNKQIGIFGDEENFEFGDIPIYEKPLNDEDYLKFTDLYGEHYKTRKTPLNKFFKGVVSVCKIEK